MIKPELLERLIEFRRERDWEQFHTPKELAVYSETREITEQQLSEVMNCHRSDVKDAILKIMYCA